jgi:hypothetical protein
MSHDPLLDKIHEVRGLLTAFRNTLVSQKRFDDRTASLFWGEDNAFWKFQANHDRLKRQGISADSRERLLEALDRKAVRWARLCRLAESGDSLGDALVAFED